MSYSSLLEAYGQDFVDSVTKSQLTNKYQDITNNIVNYNQTSIPSEYSANQSKDNIENFYDIDQENLNNLDNDSDSESDSDDEESYKDEPFDNMDRDYCNKFLYHLSICSRCREFVKKRFGSGKKIIEMPRKSNQDEFLDIALYIITGIFMLFLLDIFLKLGKYLGRK